MGWEQITAAKRDELHSRIPPEWRLNAAALPSPSTLRNVIDLVPTFLSGSERRITQYRAPQLLGAIRDGDLTCREVVFAFSHRACLAHQFVHLTWLITQCLSEINVEDALQRAQNLDNYWRENQRQIGPLHGLPVSLMDRFDVAGLDSACGFASWVGNRRSVSDEGVLVRRLRQLGAIVFCKTNVPMSMMMGETVNNIIGTTVNPFNRLLSAGGACGGEGALIALGGSICGFGTDLAGSSRIPSAFNGLWALKTSEGRLPQSGVTTVLRGLPTAAGSIGIMAPDSGTLAMTFKALLDSNPWLHDVDVCEIPWRQNKLDAIRKRKSSPGQTDGRLVFGVMTCDGYVNPHPTIKQALTTVRVALEQCGHEVVDWTPSHSFATENLFKIFGSTSGKGIRDAIVASGEPPVRQLRSWYDQGDVEPISTADFWDLCQERNEYRALYAKYWADRDGQTRSGRGIDGVILPVAPTTAVREGEFHYFGFSAVANVLDFPSGVFPVGVGDRSMGHQSTSGTTLSLVDKKVQDCFRSEDVHGLPVGLQVMCHRFQEERVLGLLEAIGEALV